MTSRRRPLSAVEVALLVLEQICVRIRSFRTPSKGVEDGLSLPLVSSLNTTPQPKPEHPLKSPPFPLMP